ncbi:MAG: carbon storage regulator CsrA [Nitrospirae bacterium]|nr:MAG: carbon storage regulator CsrA [Nitrospirota bacterium]
MLVLTRRLGEGIAIGSGIRVVVLGIRGNQVRLGIEAPPQTEIYRDEIYAKIVDENRRAAEGPSSDTVLPARLSPGMWQRRSKS